jgi:hypothetical protein
LASKNISNMDTSEGEPCRRGWIGALGELGVFPLGRGGGFCGVHWAGYARLRIERISQSMYCRRTDTKRALVEEGDSLHQASVEGKRRSQRKEKEFSLQFTTFLCFAPPSLTT